MKRSPMPHRTVPMPRGAPLRRTSSLSTTPSGKPRRQRDTGPTTKVRKLIRKRSGGWCELALPGCEGRACQASHRLGKKSGGRHGPMAVMINGAAWILDSCAACHRAITSAREPRLTEYRDAGLLLMEGARREGREEQDAKAVPVLTRHSPRPVLLDDDGDWHAAA